MANPMIELQGTNYQRREVYSMGWNGVNLSKMKVYAASGGGLLAVTRDEKKIVAANESELRPKIDIYTLSGIKLSSIVWNRESIAGMGWTDEERLVIVTRNGNAFVYSAKGREEFQFSLGREARDAGVYEAKIWGTGMAVMTNDFQILALNYFQNMSAEGNKAPEAPKFRLLGDSELKEAPTCWAIIEPQHSTSLSTEVILATRSTTMIVDVTGCHDQMTTNYGTMLVASTSPNGKYLACYTSSSSVLIFTSDLSKKLTEYVTEYKVPPEQIEWCAEDAIACYWTDLKAFVVIRVKSGNDTKPSGDGVFPYDLPLVLVPECDGIRIITNEKTEFLQKVPDANESIFAIGSTSPPAMLFDAYDLFQKRNPRADDTIRAVSADLEYAVSQCLAAAANESQYQVQRDLLRAASYGKAFLDSSFDSEKFTEMCKTIRILNALREFNVGLPITYGQYERLGVKTIINRLVDRHQHLLALKISEYQGLKADKVLVHWACSKVIGSPKDEDPNEVLELIVRKLKDLPGISYAEIASTAHRNQKTELATKLLDYEPRASEQVPLLLFMQQDDLALRKAIDSGDTDLVFSVVLSIKRKSKRAEDFFRALKNQPVSLHLLMSYCKQQGDLSLLRDIQMNLDHNSSDAGFTTLHEAYSQVDLPERIDCLGQAYAIFSRNKDTFTAKLTEEQIKLLHIQKDLEASYGGSFVDGSISDTLFALIVKDQSNRANKLRSDFKVPDKRFWWIKVRALAEIKDWAALEKFSKEKKPPIGFEPFVDVCLEAHAVDEATRYIPKIQTAANRAVYWARVGHAEEAIESAKLSKEVNVFKEIRNILGGNAKARDIIDGYIAQMS
eukprot:TRINITY_DN7643_c0_g1_i1.p1 TRINITY_DN7643_c0_g1~~TRINITY_DN7643_c0_g1_i1.p1  ORF type:complete len:843 (-),score=310.40 TRINITY_DN7643_c0_g1_i1:110-2638(-)